MSGGTAAPLQLILLWHMHQPGYGSPRTGRPLLPWVRLHATKDYLDMADRVLARPGLAVTTNLVPSLLEQVAAAAGGVADPEFEWSRRDPADLDAAARQALRSRLTIVPSWARSRFPALDRLCRRPRPGDGAPLGDDDIVQLQALHALAWIDPLYHGHDRIADATRRARSDQPLGVSERDAALAEGEALLREVLPRWRALAGHPRSEISVTPYYHPILPLLVDVHAARRAMPQVVLPDEPFAHPEDARAHLAAARRTAEAALGRAPTGLWPSEGSVSPEVLALAWGAGFRWLGSDQEVLARSSGAGVHDAWSHARPWRAGEAGPLLFFRDRELSDKIGFAYSKWPAADAVRDFMGRLDQLRREWRGPGPARLFVALDGENCWEYYPDDGHDFLERLYDALEQAPGVVTRTPGEVVGEVGGGGRDGEVGRLDQLHSGSWISSNFRIWIGHPEKNRAWDAVARARESLVRGFPEAAAGPPADAFWDGVAPVWGEDLGGAAPATAGERCRQAWRHLLIAEGSDWCWWFGDDHYTLDKAIFDGLLREHLSRVHELAGAEIPADLLAAIGKAVVSEERTLPRRILAPNINGRMTSYYEWDGAGRWRPAGAGGGAMHGGRRIRAIWYGFDERRLYLRIDIDAATPRSVLGVEFVEPQGFRFLVGRAPGELRVELPERHAARAAGSGPDGAARAGTPAGVEAAWDAQCEIAIPFELLDVAPGHVVRWVATLREAGHVVESAPDSVPLECEIPGPDVSAKYWSA